MSKVGDKCATWNCKGKLVGDLMRDNGKLMDLKCDKCGRNYWSDDMIKGDKNE